MISPYSSTLKRAVLKIRKIVPRLDFSSRAISVRCLLAGYSQHDSNVSRRNPVWICFGRLLSPRFRDRPADKLENSQCDLSIILRQPLTNYFERRVPQFHPIPTADLSHPSERLHSLQNLTSPHVPGIRGLGRDPSRPHRRPRCSLRGIGITPRRSLFREVAVAFEASRGDRGRAADGLHRRTGCGCTAIVCFADHLLVEAQIEQTIGSGHT